MKKLIVMALAVFLLSSSLFATAIDQTNIGIKAIGMGGAFTAVADDASAVFWNAAGLAFYKGKGEITAGAYFPYMESKVTRDEAPLNGTTSDSKVLNFVPSFFAVYKLTDDFALGFGFYFPYGGGKYDYDNAVNYDSSSKSFDSTTYKLTKNLHAYTFTLSAAYKINDQLSIGAGFSTYYITLDITAEDKLLVTGVYGDIDQSLSGVGFGGNIGIMYKPTKKLSLGLSTRLPVKVKLEGDFKISNSNMGGIADGTWDSYKKLYAPLSIGFGIAYKITPKWLVSMDLEYQTWKESKDIEYKNKTTDNEGENRYGWDNAFRFGIGTEYQFSEKASFIGGFKIAPSATEDHFLGLDNTDLTAYAIFLGGSYKLLKNLKVEGGFSYVYYPDAEQSEVDYEATLPATGTFEKYIFGFGLQLKYMF